MTTLLVRDAVADPVTVPLALPRRVPDVEHGPVRDDAEAGVAALFAAHHTRLLRVAAVLLSDVTAAEDVVQDAYVSLYSSWGQLRDREAAIGYLHRSVVNGARSRLRRRVVALRHTPAPLPDAASAEDTALAALADGPLLRAMRALPRREREVVLLRHYLDMSERQTAEALGLRPGSVKAYGSRGLASLREALREADDDAGGTPADEGPRQEGVRDLEALRERYGRTDGGTTGGSTRERGR